MFTSISRGHPKANHAYICTSCLSQLSTRLDFDALNLASAAPLQPPRIRTQRFSTTTNHGKSKGDSNITGAAKKEDSLKEHAAKPSKQSTLRRRRPRRVSDILAKQKPFLDAVRRAVKKQDQEDKKTSRDNLPLVYSDDGDLTASGKGVGKVSTKSEPKGKGDKQVAKSTIPKTKKSSKPTQAADTKGIPKKQNEGSKTKKGSKTGERSKPKTAELGVDPEASPRIRNIISNRGRLLSEKLVWDFVAMDRMKLNPQIAQPLTASSTIQELINQNGVGTARKVLIKALTADILSDEDKTKVMRTLRETMPKLHSRVESSQKPVPISESLKGNIGAFENMKDAMKSSDRMESEKKTAKWKSNWMKPGLKEQEIQTIESEKLQLVPIESAQPPVPGLSYGLERVLFNPGVYYLQDPRSRVFNFDPYLQKIMPASEFDFNALKEYITSSRDEALLSVATELKKKYTGSTSSMTSALSHFHFLLSNWRPLKTSNLSKSFPASFDTFTALSRGPSAIFLRYKDGVYAIDADKEYDTANILMMLGKSMEKLLTLSTEDFEKYRRMNSNQISEEERNAPEAFHYSTLGDFLMRSQLDAYDPRLPGTGMFDLKTRAVVSIRMDVDQYEQATGYEIRSRHGEYESFEREYYDMVRSAFLKYSLQVRMGRMDGIFVAYHNTERIFGFQYVSLSEMDYAIHGSEDTTTGDSEFKVSLELLNRVLDRATAAFPEKSLRIHFETREGVAPFTYIFAEPVEEVEINRIQQSSKAKIDEFEREVLGMNKPQKTKEELLKDAEWQATQAQVEEGLFNDEIGLSDAVDDIISAAQDTGVSSFQDYQRTDEHSARSASEAFGDDETGVAEREDESNLEEIDGVEEIEENMENEDKEEEEEEEEEEREDKDDGLQSAQVEGEEAQAGDVGPGAKSEHATEETQDNMFGGPELVENDSAVSIDETIAGDSESQAIDAENSSADNASSLGSKESAAEKAAENRPLMAMILTVRNKVNDEYVKRPQNLTATDKWTVEYALAEMPTQERAWSFYEKTKVRRAKVLTKNMEEQKENGWNSKYIDSLQKLAQKGRNWRKQQDEIDRNNPPQVLYPKEVGQENATVKEDKKD
ncbi:hypothetical protein BP5796_08507 [Coleophoma crateriformis]|uniref:Pet127-domain-containing protein n=1 Tax=Coleophoma crateriformis TaxID=565419 RepID=A0A3D8R839_9HELO|nr:hypothetical protein BP5796_08507 [Coleophoma crateriformis]